MRHEEASPWLEEYASGDLEPSRRQEVARHVAGCDRCAEWLETRLLIAELGGGPPAIGAPGHPAAEELARLALDGSGGEGPGREGAAGRHLRECVPCRADVELARRAVEAAREAGESRFPGVARARRALATHRGWAVAAALALLVGAAVGVGVLRPSPQVLSVSEPVLEGDRLIESPGSVVFGASRVMPGAVVTVRAGDSVAFQDGFSIQRGGTLRVESAGRPAGAAASPAEEL